MVKHSPSRDFDRRLRIQVLDIMQILLRSYKRTGNPELLKSVKEWGLLSRQLAEKIAVHNYDEADRIHYKFMIN